VDDPESTFHLLHVGDKQRILGHIVASIVTFLPNLPYRFDRSTPPVSLSLPSFHTFTVDSFSCHPESLAPPRDSRQTLLPLLRPLPNPPLARLHPANARHPLATIDRPTLRPGHRLRHLNGSPSDHVRLPHRQRHLLALLLLPAALAVQPCHNPGPCWLPLPFDKC
jgi:hypothetical protein